MGFSSRSGRRGVTALVAVLTVLAVVLPQAAAQRSDTGRIDPAALPRGADPAVAHLVHDTIRDGDLRVAATTRGRHEALWVVAGGYVVRDYNVGRSRLTVVTFISSSGDKRLVARSPYWIEVEASPSGRRVAVQTWHGALQQRTVVRVIRPASGRVVARLELRRAILAAVTDSRILLGRRPHWRRTTTQWWNYERGTVRRIFGQAAVDADVPHDRVVFTTPSRGEFCTRVAVLSHPGWTLWRSCQVSAHQWSPDGSRAIATHAYFDAAGTDRWWVVDGATAQRQATITGRLDWDAVWEDDEHFLTMAQSDAGRAAVLRCDLAATCERASRIWRVPLPSEPSLYYAPPPVVLAER